MNFRRKPFQRLIRQYARPHTVRRRDDTTSSSYGTELTYTELASDRDVAVGGLGEEMQPSEAGEIQSRRLTAYTLPAVDLQVNDRVVHGGNVYEVDTKNGRPDDEEPAIYEYELVDV